MVLLCIGYSPLHLPFVYAYLNAPLIFKNNYSSYKKLLKKDYFQYKGISYQLMTIQYLVLLELPGTSNHVRH